MRQEHDLITIFSDIKGLTVTYSRCLMLTRGDITTAWSPHSPTEAGFTGRRATVSYRATLPVASLRA